MSSDSPDIPLYGPDIDREWTDSSDVYFTVQYFGISDFIFDKIRVPLSNVRLSVFFAIQNELKEYSL